jgi:lactobin A/cerein 7B family class IIb bacteriocin
MIIMNLTELTKEELRETEGGIIPLVVCWAIVKIVAGAGATAYGIGYAVGEFQGNVANNRPK